MSQFVFHMLIVLDWFSKTAKHDFLSLDRLISMSNHRTGEISACTCLCGRLSSPHLSSHDADHKHSSGFAPLPCTSRRISTSDVVGPGAAVPTWEYARFPRAIFSASNPPPAASSLPCVRHSSQKAPFFFGPKMTSFGSQTFLLEAWNGGGNSPVVHQSKPSCGSRPPVVAAYCRENGIGPGGGGCRVRFRMRGRRSEVLVGVEKATGLRATGKGSSFEGEGGIGDDIVAGGYVDVDSAQATVNKRKKVLAMQQDLIQQVSLSAHFFFFFFRIRMIWGLVLHRLLIFQCMIRSQSFNLCLAF